ncbi:MAG: GyrI-like domain-containing protein [Elusimicrobiota bacterium]
MKKLFIILGIIAALLMLWLGSQGVFRNVEIEEGYKGPFTLVYEVHIGDYKEVGNIQNRLYKSLMEDNIDCTQGFGIYYDNPAKVKPEELRAITGCIVPAIFKVRLEKLGNVYKVKNIPQTKCVGSTFPFKNMASIIIGIMKVYPKLQIYIERNNLQTGPAMEIYDVPNKKIEYLFPIENLDSFAENF